MKLRTNESALTREADAIAQMRSIIKGIRPRRKCHKLARLEQELEHNRKDTTRERKSAYNLSSL